MRRSKGEKEEYPPLCPFFGNLIRAASIVTDYDVKLQCVVCKSEGPVLLLEKPWVVNM